MLKVKRTCIVFIVLSILYKDYPKKAPFSGGKTFIGASGVNEQGFTQGGRGSQEISIEEMVK